MQGVTNVQVLALGDIRLFGSIPEWLKNCTKLQVLDLSWNHLTGSIPPWIGSFPHLFYLDLLSNSFSGSIPPQLFSLPALINPDNNLTGLQSVVSNFAIEQKLDALPLQSTQVPSFPLSINLSHNQLQGSIPSQASALIMVLYMDLSFNNLSGNIPQAVGDMTNLQSLDLSHNSLTGKIPSSLTNLISLAYFNVSYNQLEGSIPLGNRFSTFSSESYEGNPRLCGAPLPFPCENDVNPNSSSSKIESLIIATDILEPIGVVIGYVAVLVGWLTWKLNKVNLNRRKMG
jgi:Leucine-rich repeat (LRR) protein